MLRRGSQAATVTLNPDLSMNWLYFVNENYHQDQFEPDAVHRVIMAWDDQSHQQPWRSWNYKLWHEAHRELVEGAPNRVPQRIGCDAPSFASLSEWPTLRERCQERWEEFLPWWKQAKGSLIRLTMQPDVIGAMQEIRSGMAPETVASIYVVAMSTSNDLNLFREARDGRVVILTGVTAGLLRDIDGFQWLMQRNLSHE